MGVDDEDEDVQKSEEDVEETEDITSDLSHMYSMEGQPRASSMELQRSLSNVEIFILVDAGSTHNFVHPRIAEKSSLDLRPIRPFRVYMGNRQSLVCSYMSSNVELWIQGHSFVVDLFVLPVYGPDIILELAWLQSLHHVTSDYDAETLEFSKGDDTVCLKVSPRVPRKLSSRKLASFLLQTELAALFEILTLDESSSSPTMAADGSPSPLELSLDLHPSVCDNLLHYSSVFEVPSGLPPKRPFDHRIHLFCNTKPVNVRPYRYPYFQKTEIERQVKEMFDMGIIRRSNSASLSPVLLIRKKDGSFRFCIDYRALNAVTVKAGEIYRKFGIPSIPYRKFTENTVIKLYRNFP